MFKVHPKKIEIEPLKVDTIIDREKDKLIEAGKVIQIGDYVNDFINPESNINIGDILYFEGWGCTQTPPDPEGKTHWVVWVDEKVILGKYEQ